MIIAGHAIPALSQSDPLPVRPTDKVGVIQQTLVTRLNASSQNVLYSTLGDGRSRSGEPTLLRRCSHGFKCEAATCREALCLFTRIVASPKASGSYPCSEKSDRKP